MARILLVNAATRMGGAERSLCEIARELACGDHKILAVVGGPGDMAGALGILRIDTTIVPMPRIRRTMNPLRIARDVAALATASRKISRCIREQHIDVVHANGLQSQLYAGDAARRAGVPCVWHARDAVSLGPISGRIFERATLIIAVSEAVREQLIDQGADPERVRVVLNGVARCVVADGRSPEEISRMFGIDPRAFGAGTGGVCGPGKRHEDFIHAFAELCKEEVADEAARGSGAVDVAKMNPARGIIFGGDLFGEHGRYAFGLRKLADELTGERIVFAGWRADLAETLPALDVFVSASENEPVGRMLVEAMYAGVPVIATDSGGKREIVSDGATGLLVPQGDVEALARAMDMLRRDPTRRAALGAEGRRAANERFTVERAAREVAAVWAEAIGR